MACVNDTNNVLKQFHDDKGLSFRMDFYKKYDSAPISFPDWLFSKYSFKKNDIIIEFGAGNGRHWEERLDSLPDACKLFLTDFSDGMIDRLHDKFCNNRSISVEKVDIQDVPYKDDFADVIIANHMLFHVPDLNKALSEVQRVLKQGGFFYAATDSNKGMRPFMHNIVKKFDPDTAAFTEQYSFSTENGMDILTHYFSHVDLYTYEYPLVVNNPVDITKWFISTVGISGYNSEKEQEILNYFENYIQEHKAVVIPKIAGVFACVK